METLISYRLSDLLMFSEQTYLRQIELYNQWLFPLQIVAYIYGLLCLLEFVRPSNNLALLLFLVSGFCYPLVAYGFFWQFYAGINPLADYLGALYLIQASRTVCLPGDRGPDWTAAVTGFQLRAEPRYPGPELDRADADV